MPTVGGCSIGSGRNSWTGSTGSSLTSIDPEPNCGPSTLLTREWDGQLQLVMVLADGFSWNGDTYGSLSKVAFAITGARWNSSRFFGSARSATVGGPIVKNGTTKSVRCAIYTRVSTDHGLEQDFNSLDAQHDAAQAYIHGRAHAGWVLIRPRYGDRLGGERGP